jgi:hypothetical protein
MTRLDYFLLFVLVATVAAVSPSSPLTRIIAGSGVTVVTNGVNNFTLSSTGGTTNTLIASNGVSIVTNSTGVWTISATNALAAGSGITITTNTANSWTVAATAVSGGVRPIYVNTETVTGTNDETHLLASYTNYLDAAGDAVSFIFAGEFFYDGNPKTVYVFFGAHELARFAFGDAESYSTFTFRGVITQTETNGQFVAEATGIERGVGITGGATAHNTNIGQTIGSGVALTLISDGEVVKRLARIYYEPAP